MIKIRVCILGILFLSAGVALANQPVYLSLEANGNDIEGDSTVSTMEREGTIECLSSESAVASPIDESTMRVSGAGSG